MKKPMRADPEQKYRTLYESTSDAVMLLNEQNFFDCNPATLKIFGCTTREQFLGKHPSKFSPEFQPGGQASASLSQQRIETALREGTCRFEWWHCRLDGSEFPAEVWLTAMDIGGEKVLQAVVRDITQRKQAEEVLRESQQLIQTVMDNIPQSIFWKDKNLVYLGCNRAFAADAGLASPNDALGKTDWDMPWKEQAELYRADDSRVMESGVPKLNYEEPQTTPDGSIIWLRTSKVPMRDTQGNVTAVLGMYEDITQRKRLEQQIRDSAERRGYQVQTGTEVAQEIAAAPALNELFHRVVTLIKERFGYYHAQIFRYEPALNTVVLVSGYGEAGKKMLAAGHRLEMGRSIVGTAATTGQPALATDITQDKDWRPNPNLPDTKGELAVPIKLRDQVLGILDVQSDQAGALTAEDQLLLEGLCGQIAVAIEDTRLRQQMEERLRELDTLYRATSREGWETFRQAAELPSGYLFDRTVIQPVEDLWTPEMARAVEQQVLVPSTPSPVAVSEAQQNQRGSAAVAPLSVRGEVVGALGVYDDPQRPMSSDDLALVESVSEQVALALESARLYEEARARAEELSTLNDIGRQLSSALSLEDLHLVVHQQVSRLFDTTSFFIGTYEAGSDHWQMAYHIEERQPAELGPRSLKAGFGSHMIKTQKPLMINTAQEIEDFIQAQNITRIGPSAKAWLGVPLIAAGQVVGVMAVQSYSQENIYTPRDLALFSMIGNQAAIAIQNARLFEQTQARARREQTLREITARVRSSTDPDAVMRALIRELGTVLGRSTFVRLGSAEELSEPKAPRGQAPVTPSTRGNGDQPRADG